MLHVVSQVRVLRFVADHDTFKRVQSTPAFAKISPKLQRDMDQITMCDEVDDEQVVFQKEKEMNIKAPTLRKFKTEAERELERQEEMWKSEAEKWQNESKKKPDEKVALRVDGLFDDSTANKQLDVASSKSETIGKTADAKLRDPENSPTQPTTTAVTTSISAPLVADTSTSTSAWTEFSLECSTASASRSDTSELQKPESTVIQSDPFAVFSSSSAIDSKSASNAFSFSAPTSNSATPGFGLTFATSSAFGTVSASSEDKSQSQSQSTLFSFGSASTSFAPSFDSFSFSPSTSTASTTTSASVDSAQVSLAM